MTVETWRHSHSTVWRSVPDPTVRSADSVSRPVYFSDANTEVRDGRRRGWARCVRKEGGGVTIESKDQIDAVFALSSEEDGQEVQEKVLSSVHESRVCSQSSSVFWFFSWTWTPVELESKQTTFDNLQDRRIFSLLFVPSCFALIFAECDSAKNCFFNTNLLICFRYRQTLKYLPWTHLDYFVLLHWDVFLFFVFFGDRN